MSTLPDRERMKKASKYWSGAKVSAQGFYTSSDKKLK